MDRRPQGSWAIIATFVVAGWAEVLAVPETLALGRPAWMYMVLMYWVMALPQRIGVFWGFFAGIFLDVLTGSLLGKNALIMALLAYVVQVSYKRLRVFPALQQSVTTLLLVGTGLLLGWLIQDAIGRSHYPPAWVLLSAAVSAIVWRPLFLSLRWVRRRMLVR